MTTETVDPNIEALIALRKASGLNQTEFAQWMGVTMRTLQELENGRTPIRAIHIRAAQMAALWIAQGNSNPGALDSQLRKLIKDLFIAL